jgi:hypothetical protein
MARAALTGLPLPLELIANIVNCCAEYDSINDPDPDTRYAYFLADRDPGRTRNYDPPWTTAPASVRQDVCNIRLVCKQFRSASFESFGTLLGDRRFRLIETGLQDLHDIEQVKQLVPWIKTLMFGTAQLSEERARNYFVPCQFDGNPIITGHAEALKSAFTKCLARQQSLNQKRAFSKVLVAFRNLVNARIMVRDNAKYLGGRLTPELKESADIFLEFHSIAQPDFEHRDVPFAPDALIVAKLLEAFVEAGIALRGRSHSLEVPILSEKSYILLSKLHTLRITVNKNFFIKDAPFLTAL